MIVNLILWNKEIVDQMVVGKSFNDYIPSNNITLSLFLLKCNLSGNLVEISLSLTTNNSTFLF